MVSRGYARGENGGGGGGAENLNSFNFLRFGLSPRQGKVDENNKTFKTGFLNLKREIKNKQKEGKPEPVFSLSLSLCIKRRRR